MIKDFKDGDKVVGQKFYVSYVLKGVSNAGKQYLNIILQDSSGTIEGKVWDLDRIDSNVFVVGTVIQLDGMVNLYKDKLQLKIQFVNFLDQKSEDLSIYMKSSKFSLDELKERFDKCISLITDKDYLAIVSEAYKMYGEDIFIYPAAVRNHHDYLRGLMTHMLSMAEMAIDISKHYNDDLDLSLLISGCLLHDIGKIVEFSKAIAPVYSFEGELIGHISIGYSMIDGICKDLNINHEKAILLEHVILSHHGKLEFGSPVLAKTKEALIVSSLDDLDSKLEEMNKALDETKNGEFSDRIFALDNRSVYKSKN